MTHHRCQVCHRSKRWSPQTFGLHCATSLQFSAWLLSSCTSSELMGTPEIENAKKWDHGSSSWETSKFPRSPDTAFHEENPMQTERPSKIIGDHGQMADPLRHKKAFSHKQTSYRRVFIPRVECIFCCRLRFRDISMKRFLRHRFLCHRMCYRTRQNRSESVCPRLDDRHSRPRQSFQRSALKKWFAKQVVKVSKWAKRSIGSICKAATRNGEWRLQVRLSELLKVDESFSQHLWIISSRVQNTGEKSLLGWISSSTNYHLEFKY